MKLREDLEIDEERLADICRKYRVKELSVFGSVLRDDFGPDSDVDFLYVFEPDATPGLFGVEDLREDLEDLVARDVDLGSKEHVHWYIRDRVLKQAQVVYAT